MFIPNTNQSIKAMNKVTLHPSAIYIYLCYFIKIFGLFHLIMCYFRWDLRQAKHSLRCVKMVKKIPKKLLQILVIHLIQTQIWQSKTFFPFPFDIWLAHQTLDLSNMLIEVPVPSQESEGYPFCLFLRFCYWLLEVFRKFCLFLSSFY